MWYTTIILRIFLGLFIVPMGVGFLYYLGLEIGRWHWGISYTWFNPKTISELYFYVFAGIATWAIFLHLPYDPKNKGSWPLRKILLFVVAVTTFWAPNLVLYLVLLLAKVLVLGFAPTMVALWFDQKIKVYVQN